MLHEETSLVYLPTNIFTLSTQGLPSKKNVQMNRQTSSQTHFDTFIHTLLSETHSHQDTNFL